MRTHSLEVLADSTCNISNIRAPFLQESPLATPAVQIPSLRQRVVSTGRLSVFSPGLTSISHMMVHMSLTIGYSVQRSGCIDSNGLKTVGTSFRRVTKELKAVAPGSRAWSTRSTWLELTSVF